MLGCKGPISKEEEKMKRDYKKDAWQLHVAFHDLLKDVRYGFQKTATECEKLANHLDTIFDALVKWIEELDDQVKRLEGALEELRKVVRK